MSFQPDRTFPAIVGFIHESSELAVIFGRRIDPDKVRIFPDNRVPAVWNPQISVGDYFRYLDIERRLGEVFEPKTVVSLATGEEHFVGHHRFRPEGKQALVNILGKRTTFYFQHGMEPPISAVPDPSIDFVSLSLYQATQLSTGVWEPEPDAKIPPRG